MNLDDLRIFLAVAADASFTQAAQRLSLPKSTVSRAVTRLENDLGNRLFERSTRSLRLTEPGTQLFEQTGALVGRLDELIRQAQAGSEHPQGILRIAAPYEFGVMRLGDILTEVMREHPGLEAEIDLTSDPIDPRIEDYDIVFRAQAAPLPDSDQVARRVYTISRGLYAAPELVAHLGKPNTPADLAGWPAIVSPDEPGWSLRGPDGTLHEVRPFGRLRAHNVGMRLKGVCAGIGAGLLAANYSLPEVRAGHIVRLLPDFQPPPTRVYALMPGRRLMPAKVRVFLETLERASLWRDAENPQRTDNMQFVLASSSHSVEK
ncbi:LysR family transcriptional regulator [Paludibacterium yongneupense]|uniref:LysR family transcriptional regulator n=1 Tax=Paludibacterium yongneupense TaxID=400061 RepID=UPI00040B43A0|nr:LysR family transcriptional regulator [Paludibacterium yongneupense]